MGRHVIDRDHSVAHFTIGHMMVSNVHGLFSDVSGALDFDPESPEGLQASLAIGVASLSTGVAKRDGHLKSPDFFDAARFPVIVFKGSGAARAGLGEVMLSGGLTIRDVTRPMTLRLTYTQTATSDEGEVSRGFRGRLRINREDFGMDWNLPMGGDGFMVGKFVDITVDLEADVEG